MDRRAGLARGVGQDWTRIALDAGVNVYALHRMDLGFQAHEGLPRNAPAHILVFCIAEHADNFHVGLNLLALGHYAPDCVRTAQIILDQCFIDQANAPRGAPVLPI